jgi:indolepyruvate ferredoxin oxidoreductase alpha subunit
VEEIEPFLESQVKALAYEIGFKGKIYGKQTGHLEREGELFRWQIQRALAGFLPELKPKREFKRSDEHAERPRKASHCEGCGYDRVLDALEEAARSLGQKPVLVGDPGCLVTVADRLDAKFAIGSAVGVADGLDKAGIEERAVAIFGDSAFFHTALPAICNAAHNGSQALMIVLDNRSTAASGSQSNPGVDRDARGEVAPALDIGEIARACGLERVFTIEANSPESSLVTHFRDALGQRTPTLMIVRLDPPGEPTGLPRSGL